MTNNLFIGGFPYETTQEQISAMFKACGAVIKVKILTEKETGRSRGIGFVEMATEEQARAAIARLNGAAMGSRKLFVTEARPDEKKQGGPAAKPGFVERRSGKDRRKSPGAAPPSPEGGFPARKPWGAKPGGFVGKKKWGEAPRYGGKRKDFGGEKKKWSPAGPGGSNMGPGKRKRFGSGFGGR